MVSRPVDHRIPPTGSGAWLAARSDGHRLHAGVDLGGAIGTEVHAPEAGRVIVVGQANVPSDPTHRSVPPGFGGYGPELVVVHGDSGAFHLLAHLGTVSVAQGDRVTEGSLIGTIGRTSTPHCHWEVRSRLQPIGTAAVVEICGDPAAWLAGRWEGWDGRCPTHPENSAKTPRACRPGWRGPAPRPFPPPAPEGVTVRQGGPKPPGGSHG